MLIWTLNIHHKQTRVKSGNFGHQVNSDMHLQTDEILMRGLLMRRLIKSFTVCLVILYFIPITKIYNKQGRCPNLPDRPNLPYFALTTLAVQMFSASIISESFLSCDARP